MVTHVGRPDLLTARRAYLSPLPCRERRVGAKEKLLRLNQTSASKRAYLVRLGPSMVETQPEVLITRASHKDLGCMWDFGTRHSV
jgi:hypothetical protein